MGAGHSVELTANAPSETCPGKLSVISASLDSLDPPVTAEQVLTQFSAWYKWPIHSFFEPVLKSCTVTEHNGSDDYTVKVVFDGKKLDSWGVGKGDETDRVRTWKRVTVDREKQSMLCVDYVDEPGFGTWASDATDDEVDAEFHLQMLSNPTRMEIWVDHKPSGKRLADEAFVKNLYALTDSVIRHIHVDATSKVKARSGPAMKDAGETSVLTDPMEDHVDFDSFFSKMLVLIREAFQRFPNVTFEDVSNEEFLACLPTPTADKEQSKKINRVRHSIESGEVVVTIEDTDGTILNTTWRKVHRKPLVVEAWAIDRDGTRTAGPGLAKTVQGEVNVAITRANSWFG